MVVRSTIVRITPVLGTIVLGPSIHGNIYLNCLLFMNPYPPPWFVSCPSTHVRSCNMVATDDESVSVVQAVCGCSLERAMELLEAGGSIERAVDVHFSQAEHDDVKSTTRPEENAAASAFLSERQVDDTEVGIISWEKPKHVQSPNEQAARVPPSFESDHVQIQTAVNNGSELTEARSETSLNETFQPITFFE